MKVYIVFWYTSEEDGIDGVFSSFSSAEAFASSLYDGSKEYSYQIFEYELRK